MIKKIAVVHSQVSDNPSLDDLDTIEQARIVSQTLREMGYEVSILPFVNRFEILSEQLQAIAPDLIFNLVESIDGQSRSIHAAPAMFEALKRPYTGSGAEAIRDTTNKLKAKQRLQSRGVHTPAWIPLKGFRTNIARPRHTYIIKSVWEHASIGLDEDSILAPETPEQLLREMERRAPSLGGDCFAEEFIEGREFNLSLLAAKDGAQVLPPAEISFDDYPEGKRRVVGYRAKWEADSFEYHHTPRRFDFPASDQALLNKLSSIAMQCWKIFSLRGYARVDFRVDPSGKPWVLEINANPCLSPDGGFAAAIERGGLSFRHAIQSIIDGAVYDINLTYI
ncbi:MAG: D-alanine--D-alanine ligase [Candidatus Omnitrophota bacterium]